MIVNVKKCNGETVKYQSGLGLLDLTSLMGYLFATGVVEEWDIEEYEVDEAHQPRNDWMYTLERKFIKYGKVLSDTFVNN
jgi:hypothetical protein